MTQQGYNVQGRILCWISFVDRVTRYIPSNEEAPSEEEVAEEYTVALAEDIESQLVDYGYRSIIVEVTDEEIYVDAVEGRCE